MAPGILSSTGRKFKGFRVSEGLEGCPLWVKSRRFAAPSRMSAFGGKADVNHNPAKGPLIAKTGH